VYNRTNAKGNWDSAVSSFGGVGLRSTPRPHPGCGFEDAGADSVHSEGLVHQAKRNSCHQQLLPAIAVRAAREHGIPLNDGAARTHVARTFAFLSGLDKAVQYNEIIDPTLDDGYQLVAAHAAGVTPNLTTAVYARHIALRQQPDGHWITGDARPPQSYSSVTATAIALRVIQLYSHPVARLLLDRGAKMDAVDSRGMTALLYAASADFGNSSKVDLLLKMGANPAARTKEGLTASDLARKYGHSYLAASFVSSSLR